MALVSCYPVRVEGEVTGVGIVLVDISERRQAEELRSVVMDTMAEGLYVVDHEGRLVLMNAAASRMLGWSEDELRGKPAHSAFHHHHADGSPHPAEECDLKDVWSAGKLVRSRDDAFTSKDGSILPVAYSAAPLINGPHVRGAVVVFRDITAEKSEQARLQRELNALTWVGRTRDALDENRLVLYGQPIVPLNGGERGEELLLRMVDRDGEIILPGSFLPSAEKYGLIGEIDRWVVTEAIPLARPGRRIEINLSADSVGNPEMLRFIGRQLRDSNADPSSIVFEITETALMRDIDAGERFAVELADLGCRIALDDFGTGFGSFTYLKRLPIHYLKIDIDFIQELTTNPANQHVVKAIVSLAQGFGQKTIAEGVEDGETLALLHHYSVDFAQGYHLGRPAPIATVRHGSATAA